MRDNSVGLTLGLLPNGHWRTSWMRGNSVNPILGLLLNGHQNLSRPLEDLVELVEVHIN